MLEKVFVVKTGFWIKRHVAGRILPFLLMNIAITGSVGRMSLQVRVTKSSRDIFSFSLYLLCFISACIPCLVGS